MNARLRVLVVDDDFVVAALHQQFVAAHPGFEVVGQAHSGQSALDAIGRLRPDVVLLDLYLPDMSGLDVLNRIRSDIDAFGENSRHIEVIALTAARDLHSIRTARSGGVVHYLVKPFSSAALTERLDHVLQHHQAIRLSSRELSIDQATVDRIIRGAPPVRPVPGRLPKGLGQPTLELIVATLRDFSADASAAEVADKAGLSRVSARRYLEYLSSVGRADISLRYGQAGRPESRYRSANQ